MPASAGQQQVQRLPLPARSTLGATVSGYWLPGPSPMLVDPGPDTADARTHLAAALAGLGDRPARPALFVVTHAHPDHAGAAIAWSAESGIPIAAHPLAEPALRDPAGAWANHRQLIDRAARAGAVPTDVIAAWSAESETRRPPRPLPSDPTIVPLTDGPVPSVHRPMWRVVVTPGHSPDHVCLMSSDGSAMLLGDLLQRQAATVPWLASRSAQPASVLAELIASWRRIARLPATVLWPAHGPEIRAHRLLIARRLAATRSDLIAARRAVAEGADTVWAVAEALARDRTAPALGRTLSEVIALLGWLSERRLIERSTTVGVARYRSLGRPMSPRGGR